MKEGLSRSKDRARVRRQEAALERLREQLAKTSPDEPGGIIRWEPKTGTYIRHPDGWEYRRIEREIETLEKRLGIR